MRVLVVDDSKAMRLIVSRALRHLGINEIQEASNGREALALLEGAPPPAALFVDWNMPEMDGLSLVRAVRAIPALNATKIVMVTTEAENERVTNALQYGANEYVMKPFTEDVLKQKLQILGLVR